MKTQGCSSVLTAAWCMALFACSGETPRGELSRTSSALTQQSIAVPSYFHGWSAMLAHAPPTRLVVVNPNSGPGTGYETEFAAAKAAGVKAIGYVDTNYAARSASTVMSEIDQYYSLYPGIDGIFFDRTSNQCDRQPYYASLYQYIKNNKSASATVALNHGTGAESCYLSAGDILITFENDYGDYVNNFSPTFRSWETAANSNRIWHIVYGASSSQLADALNLSRARQAGYVFVTNLGLPNPYGALPSYFSTEAANVSGFNASQSTTLTRLRASNDAANAFYSFHFSSPDTFHRVYIDTDTNAATGFAHCSVGANYMVEDGGTTSRLYVYTGNGSSWSWNQVGTMAVSRTATSITWTVPRENIGEGAYPNDSDVCFEAETSGGARTTSAKVRHAYSNESGPIHAYFAENDATTVYYQATFDVSYAQKHVFIDTDQNAATGYPVGGIGANFMVENGNVYQYTGTPPAWSWSSIGASSMSPSTIGATGATSFAFARSLIGETGASESSHLVFHGRTAAGVEFITSPVYLHTFSN